MKHRSASQPYFEMTPGLDEPDAAMLHAMAMAIHAGLNGVEAVGEAPRPKRIGFALVTFPIRGKGENRFISNVDPATFAGHLRDIAVRIPSGTARHAKVGQASARPAKASARQAAVR